VGEPAYKATTGGGGKEIFCDKARIFLRFERQRFTSKRVLDSAALRGTYSQ
jgi:hypothetical protein